MKKNYFKKLADMTPEERTAYFTKLGSKGGRASKKVTDYAALGKLSWKVRRKKNLKKLGKAVQRLKKVIHR